MYITHHPDDDMSELKISGSKYSRVTCDNCSAAETDTGRMVTVGMSLKTLFDQHQITRKYVVIVCCGEDIEYDMVKDLDDYVNDRHECIVVYGHQELQKLSTDVTKMVKWMRKASKSRDKRSRRR
jgi:predicted nucleic-acid-binding Zn-ribbon protein